MIVFKNLRDLRIYQKISYKQLEEVIYSSELKQYAKFVEMNYFKIKLLLKEINHLMITKLSIIRIWIQIKRKTSL